MGHCFPAEKYQVESFCFYHHLRASLEWNIISGNLYMGDKSQSFFLPVSVETLLTMEKNTEIQLCLFLPALFALGVTALDLATFMPVLTDSMLLRVVPFRLRCLLVHHGHSCRFGLSSYGSQTILDRPGS